MSTPRFSLELASAKDWVPYKIQDMGVPVSGVLEGDSVKGGRSRERRWPVAERAVRELESGRRSGEPERKPA